jgi:hypothetical protein
MPSTPAARELRRLPPTCIRSGTYHRASAVPDWLQIVLYCLAVVTAVFVCSGVVGRYRAACEQLRRVRTFTQNYVALIGGDVSKRAWLAARANEMQQDAMDFGEGVTYVAPPPMRPNRNRRVSAVLHIPQLAPWTVVTVEPELWINPYTTSPLTAHLPWATEITAADGEIRRTGPTEGLRDLFGLTETWPGPERSFDRRGRA